MFQGINWIDALGHGASLLVLVSLTMSSLQKLRWLNLVGAVCFASYGWLIEATPIATVNVAIVAVNAFYLVRMYSQRDYFQLLEIDGKSKYLEHFFHFHEVEIRKWYPDFFGPVPHDHIVVLPLITLL